ncbi:MAG: polysaccharide biosynthesis/export family protein [Pseudomonadota bacterium]
MAAPDEQKYETLGADYRIAPMDKLNVKVFRAPDLSGDYEVDLTGNIALPLIGNVTAANLTTSQLRDILVDKLGAKYLEHPDVAVAITASTAHNVTVGGAVQNSGSFPIRSNMTLVQAIALANGTREDANNRRVAIFRTIGGQRQAAAFDLTAISRGQSPDPTIYPGDIVVVDGSRIKAFQKQLLSTVPLLSVFRPVL